MIATRNILPSDDNLVWYAGYGSNLYRGRFDCYISGGKPKFTKDTNTGCRDKNPARSDRTIKLPHQLYFANHSETWWGAVAFIRPTPSNAVTYGRMYLITYGQFNDVACQENGPKVRGKIIVPPFDELARGHDWPIAKLGRHERVLKYGRLLKLGTEGGHPILTISATSEDFTIGFPSEDYVKTIVLGLRETYPSMCEPQILEYLAQARGIRDAIHPTVLRWVLGQ